MTNAEVLIVGGGPAGISTALFLAHAAPDLADRIVVLEKATFPREKFCAGAVGGRADRLLLSIGVRVDVPSAWVDGVGYRMQGETRAVRDENAGRVVRRIEFDHALAKVAQRRGIRIAEGAAVRSVRFTGQGVELDSVAGVFRSRVVVGADGVTSVVRRAVGLPSGRFRAQAIEVDTVPVDGDPARDLLFFDLSRRELDGYYWDFPTIVDGRELVCRGVYHLRHQGKSVDLEAVLAEELQTRGLTLSGHKKKRFAERGYEMHAAYSQEGLLLVGEAAGIDPVTGEGIAQAIQYGAVAGRYLARKIAASDLRFEDWSAEVRTTMIGRDLITRTMFLPLIYGRYRTSIERYLLDSPECVRIGLEHFSGKKWSKRSVASAGVKALAHTARALIGGSSSETKPLAAPPRS